MDFLNEKLEEFVLDHTVSEPELLSKLNRDTWANVLIPRMLSGHLQGRVLSTFSHMIRPKYILEIGTYTGYSAICLSEGLQNGGQLHTIDINEELAEMVDKYVNEAGYSDRIIRHVGNALDIIPTLEYNFDLVFIDADKENYSNYFDLVIDRIPSGGYIIADNVLWSGNVILEEQKMDEETKGIVAYCKKVHEDERVENVLFTIRDGLMVCRKL